MNKLSIPLKYGIFTAIALIAYFLILSLFGLNVFPAYSLFNAVITAAGMYLAIKKYRDKKGDKFKYQKGFATGMYTGFVATILFTVFFAVYAADINPEFFHELVGMWESEYETPLGLVIFGVALMGASTTVALTLTYMQLFKRSWNTKEGNKHRL
ncbi:DUF4199 domain-containing protein [Zunongwangia sp. F363]|uniref:DUF4199 domain-containing protein n=1 Tax=Autumnicola tepida TaxID=3075595 RepID=A0ABU3C9W0_9FLAO|nr:DUF4199 domain-containing protein [Zunongwangia sp. F363]MDT0643109.1 DUF4199 domain-containing protein [Zunongwangia sp. F363]